MGPLFRRVLVFAFALACVLSPALSAQDPAAPAAPGILGTPSVIPQDGVPDILTGMATSGGIARVFSGADSTPLLAGAPFGGFTGGVRVAAGDIDGDGAADLVTAQGAGGGFVRIFNGSGVEIASGYPFGPAFTGGIYVATGDVNGDGLQDVVVATGLGGLVRVYSLAGGLTLLHSGFPYGPTFTGGVRVAAGDVNGDGHADILTAPASGAAPVKVFSGTDLALLSEGAPYGPGFTGGVFVAAGDVNGDGVADIITSPGAGPMRVRVFTGPDATPGLAFLAAPEAITGGLSVAAADLDGDGKAEIIGGLGPGGPPLVALFDGTTGALLSFFTAEAAAFRGGVLVAASAASGIRFTSAATTTFTTGTAGTFTITTSAAPTVNALTVTGALPTGVTFIDNGNGTASLSGTPAAGTTGTYPLTFTASNGVGADAVQHFTLTVQVGPAITSADTTTFTVGAAGTFAVTTTGFPTPAITRTGPLPTGVDLVDNSNGTATLSGTPGPGSAGTYPFTINAGNTVGSPASQSFTLTVQCVAISVTPPGPALPQGTFGAAYSQTFSATGGAAPHTFSIAAGTIPTGLTLQADGNLTGSPSVTGTFNFTVKAMDTNLCEGTRAYTLAVIPDAQPDTFTGAVGNTQLAVGTTAPSTPTVSLSGSVLANDSGPATLTAGPGVIVSTNGGAVTMNANGTFGYTPPAGFAGPTDTFQYTLTDGSGASAPGMVTIGIAGLVWYVNSAGGMGTGVSSSPFNDLDAAEAASSPGSTIFVHTGGLTTSDDIVLKDGQTLWGQGTAFTLGNLTIAAGGKPTLSSTVVIGGNDVMVSSLAISAGTNFGMTNIGSPTGLTVKNGVTIATTTGAAISFNGVSASAGAAPDFGINIQSVSTTGAGNGIVLSSVNAAAGAGEFRVTGDGASDPDDTTRGRTTAAQGGGTLDMNSGGTIESSVGVGVLLLNGTKNVTLRNMRIQNNDSDGLRADNVTSLTLDNVLITGHADDRGLHGVNLTGLSMQHVDINSNATSAASALVDVSNVNFGLRPTVTNPPPPGECLVGSCPDGLKGTVTVANSSFASAFEYVWLAWEANAATLNMTVTNSRFANAPNGSTFLTIAQGTSNVSIAVSGSLFENSKAPAFAYNGEDSSGGGTLAVTNNTFTNNGVDIAGAHQGLGKTVTMNFSSNITRQAFSAGSSVSISALVGGNSNAGTLVNATIANNVIGNAAVANSGSDLGSGIAVESRGAGTINVLAANNVVRQVKQNPGFYASANHGTSTLNLTMTNNDIQAGSDPVLGYLGLDMNAGGAGGATAATLCANFTADNIAFVGGPSTSGAGVQVLAAASTVNLVGYGGAPNNTANIISFLSDIATTVSPTPTAPWVVTVGGTIQAAPATCTTPP